MSRKKKGEEAKGLPSWVLTFSDMTTLLLSFFVLLQAFAKEQDDHLFDIGINSYKSVVQNFGLPVRKEGRDQRFKREWYTRRYSDEPSEEENSPIIDAEEEQLQKMFQELKDQYDSASAEMEIVPIRVEATPVKFSRESAALNRSAKQYLNELAVDLQNNLPPESSSVYLVGLAPDQKSSQKRWVLSVLRAEVAKEYLEQRLNFQAQERVWNIYSWGGGTTFGRFPEGTLLGLVVMGENHDGRNESNDGIADE